MDVIDFLHGNIHHRKVASETTILVQARLGVPLA